MQNNSMEHEKLIEEIDAFCAKHGINRTNFGILAINNSALVTRLKRNHNFTMGTIARVQKFMSAFEEKPEEREKL